MRTWCWDMIGWTVGCTPGSPEVFVRKASVLIGLWSLHAQVIGAVWPSDKADSLKFYKASLSQEP